ncbi:HEPN domain-containing protein [Paenibacillus montaniterrae]|nr:HEPN domain-containing protein [Paenibacillus montaniterrae]
MIHLQAILTIRISDFLYKQLNNVTFNIHMNEVGDIDYYFSFIDEKTMQIDAHYPIDAKRFENSVFDEVFTKEACTRVIYRDEFNVMIHNFYLACQISDPAGFEITNIKILVDGYDKKFVFTKSLLNPFSVGNLVDEKNPFSRLIDRIHVNSVIDWLKGQKDFWKEVAQSKTGISINYFRYFHEENGPMNCLWLCMALEALLVTNQNFSRNQIYGKLRYFIDEEEIDSKTLQKLVDNFYSFRSKIVHGKLNLYRPTMIHNATKEVDILEDSITSNESFGYLAVRICLYNMIKNNIHNLDFEEEIIYKLKQ